MTPDPNERDGPKAVKRARVPKLLLSFSLLWLGLVVFHAILASRLPYVVDNPAQTANAALARIGPGRAAWFGGDQNGRDIFSYCVYGARASLLIGFSVAILGMLIGGGLGLISGYYRGWVDTLITSFIDVMLSFPSIILLIAITSLWGREAWKIVIGLTALSVAPLARLVRANTLVYTQREFVTAARALGATNRRILVREVLPNIVPVALSFALLTVAFIIVAEGTLSFLGVGLNTSIASWGTMIVQGRGDITLGVYHVVLMPSLVLVLTVFTMNVVGESLRRRFDIREAAV